MNIINNKKHYLKHIIFQDLYINNFPAKQNPKPMITERKQGRELDEANFTSTF